MIADLRFALRQLRRSPGFSAAAIITLALGIGACTAAYSLARGMLWRPLPFPDADHIVVVHGSNPSRGISHSALSYADVNDLRARNHSIAGLAALEERQSAVGAPDGADHVIGFIAEPSFFQTMGVAARLGRVFRADEALPAAAPVVMLSWPYYTRRFGRDTSVIGRTIPVDNVPRTIIGVMGPDFSIVRGDIWLPLVPDLSARRDDRVYVAAGRLKSGVTISTARAELESGAASLASTYPATNRGWGIELATYRDDKIDQGTRSGLALMLGAVAMVLLIACANVAGLLLARGAARSRELAVRAAIGAGRGRLVRQALIECGVLAAIGGALGLGLAGWANDLLLGALPAEDLPAWLNYSLDGTTLAVVAGITTLSVLIFGLLPALRASRPSVVNALKGGAGAAAGTRIRSALVVAQVALAVVLLTATALVSQGFLAKRRGDIGFDYQPITTARVFFGAVDRPERARWMRDALERLRGMPGVTGAALTGALPGDDGGDHRGLAIDGRTVAAGEEPMVVLVPSSDALPEALGITPVSGRWFTRAEAEDPKAAVAVVGAGMARRFWPGGDAIGHRVRALPDTAALTIVGILPDLQYEEFGEAHEADRLQLHVPYGRESWRGAVLMVRGRSSDASGLTLPVARTARGVRADVPVFDAMTMVDDRRTTTASDRSWVLIFGSLGAQALLMTAVGLYGLLAFGVTQRRREIGVRVALGARPRAVVEMVVRRSLVLTAGGLAIGLAAAFAAARVLKGLLWGVDGTLMPVVIAAAALLVTALFGAFMPARRAALVDPMEALRAE